MKNHELEKIAGITGFSKSTVSKALNHCFGVERQSREIILEAARAEGIRADRACDVYGIFPDRPVGFWTQALDGFISLPASGIPCKFNICAYDSDEMLTGYLEEAIRLGARLLLVGGCPNTELIRKTATDIPVFFLFARPDIVNTFSFSVDARAEGEALRRRLQPKSTSRVLLLDDGDRLTAERVRGFLTEDMSVRSLTLADPAIPAAILARRIQEVQAEPPDLLYAAAGPIREAALAASKLGLRNTAVIGHDQTCEGTLGGVRYLGFAQDTSVVCRAAADAAAGYIRNRRFPSVKHTVIPL